VFATFNVDTAWAQANRGLVVRFLRAILRAYETFYTDREAAIQAAMIETGINRALSERTYDAYATAQVFPRDGEISTAGVQALIETSSDIRSLPTRAFTHADDYIDRSYLLEARATLA
jgi:ABC-type nitrate/sulfonate/bicarbonate transport system substrate-binding protein